MPENERKLPSGTCFFKILDDGQSPKEGDCVSYFIGAVFSCLCTYDSLTT
jgi:hypothetical protein